MPLRSATLIELNVQREQLRGSFQSGLFPLEKCKLKGNCPPLSAWWDLLLQSWLSCARGRWSFSTCGGRAAGQWDPGRSLNFSALVRDPQTYFYLVVQLSLCNYNALSVQSEINTEPHLPWEYLSKFSNEYSLEFSCSYVLLGPSWL